MSRRLDGDSGGSGGAGFAGAGAGLSVLVGGTLSR